MVVELRIRSREKIVPSKRLTYEQFLEWADEDTYAEWVDGKVELISPAGVPHQRLAKFIAKLFDQYVEDRDDSVGEAFIAPFQMRLANVRRGREPDVFFLTGERLSLLKRNYLDGPADIAVEIISPESALRDRGAKYGEYEAGGVREYWVFDPEAQRADFFVLSSDGRYERAQPNAEGIYHSAVLPEFWFHEEWLWRTPLPTMREVRQSWETQK